MNDIFNVDNLLFVMRGAMVSLILFGVSFMCSIILGVVIGALRQQRKPWPFVLLGWVLILYSSISRRVPLIVLMLFLYFGLALIGLRLNAYVAALVALVAWGSSWMGEIVRGSLGAVGTGQWHAGRSLGMSTLQILRYVAGPQALKLAWPPTMSFAALLLKATSLASIVGVMELTRSGYIVSQTNNAPLIVMPIVAAIYIAMVSPLLLLAGFIDYSRKPRAQRLVGM